MSNNNKSEMNEFFFEARTFIGKGFELVKPKMVDFDALLALLLCSIGIEKILKGILFDINPLYVLNNFKFEESTELFYKERIIDENIKNNIKIRTRDLYLISFSTAIKRCKFFSKTVSDHITLLHKVAEARNVIAHNICSHLNIDRNFLRPFLLRDLNPLIRKFSKELKFRKDTFFTPIPWEISLYGDEKKIQEKDLSEEILEKFTEHKIIWDDHKADQKYFKEKFDFTKRKERKGFNILISCPVCENESLLYYEPDVEYEHGINVFNGLYVTELECNFCGLNIFDYDEVDYLRLNDQLMDYFKFNEADE